MYKQLLIRLREVLLTLALIGSFYSWAEEKKVDTTALKKDPLVYTLSKKSNFKIQFIGRISPGGSFEGQAREATGEIQITPHSESIAGGAFFVPIKSVSTGNDRRDKHMREKYLEINKKNMSQDFVLKLLPASYKKNSKGKILIPVEWKIHGKSQTMEVEVMNLVLPTEQKGKLSFSSQFQLKLSDFGIKAPSYMVVWMKDTIEVSVQMQLVYQDKKESHEKVE